MSRWLASLPERLVPWIGPWIDVAVFLGGSGTTDGTGDGLGFLIL